MPNKKLSAALPMVESKSIRAWATSAHNLPIFNKLAAGWKGDKFTLATYIVALAIGL